MPDYRTGFRLVLPGFTLHRKKKDKMKKIWIPQAIVSLMLLWALYPGNPYGYYTLLRWVCCGSFAFLAFKSIAINKQGWAWILGVTAILYNPFSRIYLTRDIWSILNIITIGIAIWSIFILKEKKETGNYD